jgi:serine/threonine protein kinase
LNKANENFILKVIDISERNEAGQVRIKEIDRELLIGGNKENTCPFLVHYLDYFNTGNRHCFIMKLYKNGDLYDFIKKIYEENKILEEKV